MIMIYCRHVAAIQEQLQANQYTVNGNERGKASDREGIQILTQTLLLILEYIKFNQLLIRYENALFNIS